jgi:predicted DNA-binding transcriptional regulator AlpA
MRRHRTRRRNPAGPVLAVDHRTSPPLRRRLAGARFGLVGDSLTLLVNSDAVDIDIAEAAWRILSQTGGLVDRSDIARRHGLSRQRTYEMTGNLSFPKPVGQIGGRPVWLKLAVDRYRAHAQPGRPRRSKDDPPSS